MAVGKPQKRIGQRLQLVPVVFRRLVIGGIPHLDREQVVGDLAPVLVHDDIGVNRLSRLNRRSRRSRRAAAAACVRRAGCTRNRSPIPKTAFRGRPPAGASACARRDPSSNRKVSPV